MDIFDHLNDAQREAVLSTEGKIKVVAGAGSGKTRVLAHRFAHLVDNIGVDAGNILCMTFTNKAAQEMRVRISKLIDSGIGNDLVCTIHGFCVKVLRKDIHRLGWPKNFKILDDEDTEQIAKQVLELHGLDRTKKIIKELLQSVSIHKAQIEGGYIDTYMLTGSLKFGDVSGLKPEETFIHYQALNYCLNFDDIISFALYLFNNYPDVREYWQDQINYVMVDEAQDCNSCDWLIAETVAAKYGNLFVVGDPDQAIYEWRGAKPSDFVNWKADKTIILAHNYRSTPNILDVANSIIAHNKNRIPKDLYTEKGNLKSATHFHGKNEGEEAEYVVKTIKQLEDSGRLYSDMAILYRASHVSRSIEQTLLREKIPYEVWGGVRFFERREIKDILAYLNMLVSDDNLAFARIVNVPKRNFGPTSLKKIKDISEIKNISYYQALKENLEEWKRTKAYNPLRRFIELIEDGRKMLGKYTIVEILNEILKSSGITEMLREDTETERLENVEELISSVRLYEQQHEDDEVTLETYLQDISLFTNSDHKKEKEKCVKLMTIHQSKGLEFPIVFVCGLSEGIFPSHRSLRERKLKGLEEERRLMYVAVTRAEEGLFLTESEGFNFQTHTDKFPSRFLTEIKKNLIVREGSLDESLWEGTLALSKSIDKEIMPNDNNDEEIKIGTLVAHNYLGIGKVIEISADRLRAKVRFGDNERSDRYLQTKVLKPL